MTAFHPPGQCPACGEWVPRKALACDCCGACARSGWKANAEALDGLDLPDDPSEFDYDAFIEEEFGGGRRTRGMATVWWWTALALAVAFGLALVLGVR